MRIEKCQHMKDAVKVHVEPNELDCGQRLLPYGCCVGVVHRDTRKCEVWMPAASTPRGYRKAAARLLAEVAASG